MNHYFDTVINAVTGKPLAGVQVSVLLNGSLATIYADQNGTPLTNPVTSDANGLFGFYANEGNYSLEYRYSGALYQTITNVILGGSHVSVRTYGAVGDGATNDATAIQSAINAANGKPILFPYSSAGYKVNTALVLPASTTLVGQNGVRLFTTIAGQHIASATNVADVTIQGLRFEGADSSTSPLASFGGTASVNTGLLSITGCTDVRVTDCEFNTFYNGISAQKNTRIWIERNRVRNFKVYGVLGSVSTYANISENIITDCTQTGGSPAYGVQITGDEAGGNQSIKAIISRNQIKSIKSWDGIMSHDITDLTITENQIEDVRTGIDVGHFSSTDIIRRALISNNTIVGTTTDTWGGAAANSGGILLVGYDATHRIAQAVISDNIVSGFFNISGMTGTAGISSHITAAYADDVTITGNTVTGGGNTYTNAGVLLAGTVNRATVLGNSLQGQMASAGIRAAALTADILTIGGGSISQTTTTDPAINVNGGTIGSLAVVPCATNSSVPYTTSGSTVSYSPGAGPFYKASATYDPPSLTTLTGATTTVSVTGASVGDAVSVGFSNDLQGITVSGYVNASNSVAVRFQNDTAGTLDLASGTLTVLVRKI